VVAVIAIISVDQGSECLQCQTLIAAGSSSCTLEELTCCSLEDLCKEKEAKKGWCFQEV